MRKLIKNILKESFLSEKAAPRRMATPKKIEESEEDYNKTGWIHSAYVNDKGNFKIIWKDDLRKIERKYEEIRNLESSIEILDNHIERVRRDRHSPPGYLSKMMGARRKHINDLQKLKDEIESQSIDNPIVNFFE